MATIVYLDPDGEAPVVVIKGVTFKAGEAVETDDVDLLARFRNHPHFKVEDGEAKPAAKPAPAPAPKPAPAAAKK
jgi:hypothetical protein